jgi:integrase
MAERERFELSVGYSPTQSFQDAHYDSDAGDKTSIKPYIEQEVRDLSQEPSQGATAIFSPNTATLRPFFQGLLSIPEASNLYHIPERTLRRWCETGRVPATAERKRHRTSYWLSPQALEFVLAQNGAVQEAKMMLKKASVKPHAELISGWVISLQRGTLNGKVFSPETIKYYEYYVSDLIRKHQKLSIQTLKTELSRIDAANFSRRYKVYKASISFAKHLIAENALDPTFLQEAKPLFPKRHDPPKRYTVTHEGIEALLGACQSAYERAMVVLLSNTGLRAAEASALKLEDIDLAKGILVVRRGKGGKQRKLGLSKMVIEAISLYLHEHPSPHPNSYLFLDSQGNKLGRTSLYHKLSGIGKRADVPVSCHALRRAFVTINANLGRSLVMLQHACGHSDITTTRSYCLTTEQEVIDAMREWH